MIRQFRRLPPRARRAGVGGVSGAALVAAIAAAMGVGGPVTKQSEGRRHVAYGDRLTRKRVATVCEGITGPEIRVGAYYNDRQCDALFQSKYAAIARTVAACTANRVVLNPYLFGAEMDVAFNVGPRAVCKSTAVARFNRGDIAGGCAALGPSFTVNVLVKGKLVARKVNGFIFAGGKVRPGLVTRRKRDRDELCRPGLTYR